jgi:sigma-B regulation protein RsbU (phosphoserine phosphatase)
MPFVLRPGRRAAPLGRPGALGGAFPEGFVSDDATDLRAGDALLFYTDGVTDARGAQGRFEIDRLTALLDTLAGEGADAIVAAVDGAVRDFQVGPQRDDIALLALEVA